MNTTVKQDEARIPIFPRSVQGRFRTIKYAILFVAYATYFILPWLPWHRTLGPNQSILFDIVERRFYLFDLVVYAQDIFWLAGFLIIASILLFFVTGIAGRVFCGYFCFQTLWTDVFMLIERLVQGERNARIKLACSSWTVNKILKMLLTWLLWLAVAFWTGFSFVLYWGEAGALLRDFFAGHAPFPAYATTLFLTASTFVMAGLAREQVCTYMCPYARFQGVMYDEYTMVVAYDKQRGEAEQGRHKPDKQCLTQEQRHQQGWGDCIDCGYCVQVCPTGIDIRDGLQYQCISCALCIDACNNIMDATGFARGLIRYTSSKPAQHSVWLRPKSLAYAAVLLISTTWLMWSVLTRAPVELRVEQVRQPLYVMLSDGQVQNHYVLKINNKTSQRVTFTVDVRDIPANWEARPDKHVDLAPGQSVLLDVLLRMPMATTNQRQHDFHFDVHGEGAMQNVTLNQPASFFWPKAE